MMPLTEGKVTRYTGGSNLCGLLNLLAAVTFAVCLN